MRRWHNIVKRSLPRRTTLGSLSTKSPLLASGEGLLLGHELSTGSNPSFVSGGGGSLLDLSHSFCPFTVIMLHGSKYCSDTVEYLWALFVLTLRTTDASLSLSEAHLFSGSSVVGYYSLRTVLDRLKTVLATSSRGDLACMRLVIALVTSPCTLDESLLVEVRNLRWPIPVYTLQLILSVSAAPSILACILNGELGKCSGNGVSPEFFAACLNGLLSNDQFFSSVCFHEMHLLLVSVVESIGPTFDFLSLKWTPLLSKLSRIYMRQSQGELLASLHFKLLQRIPALETKMPLTYIVRTLGSLVDASAGKDDTRVLWCTILDIASLAVRLHGNSKEGLQAVWKPFFKAAVTLKPNSLNYARVLEAYHVSASQGLPMTLDKTGFSQVVRFLLGSIAHSSLEETSAAMRDFYRFLKEHPSIHFLWILDSLISLLGETWESHGDGASALVQDFIKALQEDYFPSMRLSGVSLIDNPQLRPLLEKFHVVNKTEFWWRCGCGAQLPASAKRCLMCMRRRNAAWTCVTCGAVHKDTNVEQSCICGSANPRRLKADAMGLELCLNCGGVLDALSGCVRCGNTYREELATRACSFCGKTYSQRAVCCPLCYAANEDKKPLLWCCGVCGEYNHWTWSQCQRCPGRRRVGCVVAPLEPWVCGCGRRNHPCLTNCEVCSRDSCDAYTCNFCNTLSSKHSVIHLELESKNIRVIACQHCGHLHPRDHNVLCSPYLQRRCHQCGKSYIRANLLLGNHCNFCHANLSCNELIPFKCHPCKSNILQTGFHCVACLTPRSDAPIDDAYVWKCNREVLDPTASGNAHFCGHWNYSWLSHCRFCGEGRAQSKYEGRARCLSWVCADCHHRNLPTDVFFCSQCSTGIQVMEDCCICGLPHPSVTCASSI
ncbi:uncharacterized protein Tco025E_03151 [Trypanosoma conorhini]|uniref:RanBP2-type domain-containing protein n=1 Tax=Trypanosoma conorhini TaxID=83891 RepID=A0A422PWN6_9TRYP|nr:uncharacterized protein Tco025E_03151 [Trypanosoma conorhini]RNF22219.1 hypothetical protein Tco025E_03151 [Trypanosoma conorhini]